MRQYEIVVILSPMLNQTENTEAWDSVKTFISGHEGNVVTEHSWGTRRLAYPIQKGQQKYLEGTYHLSRFETESPFNKELENHLRLDDRVLRSLIVSITDKEAEQPLDAASPGSADAPLGRRPGYQGQRPQYGGGRDQQSPAPAAEATTEAPAAEATTEAPAAEETAETPAAEATTEAPAAEETAETPAAEATTEAPAAEETAETPADEETSKEG